MDFRRQEVLCHDPEHAEPEFRGRKLGHSLCRTNPNEAKGDLTAPEATQKVDPAYPLELMRRNVQGTVTLYAVIRNDGSVSDVRVLRGVDDQLDQYARAALARWHFRPATKNGAAVDLEAVVMIPFKPVRLKSSF